MKTRRIISVICTLAMILSIFAGCTKVEDPAPVASEPVSTDSSSTADSGAETAPEGNELIDPVDITIWFYPRYVIPGQDSGIFEQQLIDEFRAIPGNENINIKFEMLAWDAGPEKVNIAIATDATPDAILDFPGRIVGYGLGGALYPMDDMISPETIADIDESIWESCRGDGKIYFYPTAITYVTMGVNAKIFRDAGLEDLLPKNETRTWTNEEFEKALEELSKIEGIAPFGFYAKNEQGDAGIRMMIQSQGTDFVNAEQNQVVINSDEGKEGLAWIKSLHDKGYMVKNPETLTNANVIEMFMQSKVAIIPCLSAANLPTLQSMIEAGNADPEFDVMFVTYPTKDGTNPKVESQIGGYGIFDNGDENKAKAAMRFIEFAAAKPETVTAQGIFPVRNSMDVSPLNPKYADEEHQYLQSLSAHLGNTGYTMKNYAEVRAAFYPQIQAMLTGQKTPEQALDDFATESNTILAK